MKMPDLIRAAESKCRGLEREYEASRHRLRAMRERVDTDAPPSDAEVREATETHERISDRLDDARGDLESLRAQHLADLEVVRMQNDTTPTGVSRGGKNMSTTSSVHVVGEPDVYRRDAGTDQPTFLADLFKAQVRGDSQAHSRLARHGQHMEATLNLRAGTDSSMVPSFVPPTWLQELVSDYARPSRPVADLVTNLPLPETGMVVNVPSITEPTAVAAQSSENSAVQDSEPEDTTIACNVVTIGGSVDVSWQALERGYLVQELIFRDLGKAYGAAIDAQVLDAIGAATGINQVTFTETSPTVTTLYTKIADGIGKVRANRYASPSAIVMSPRLWAWLTAAIAEADDRPWIVPVPAGPTNAGGVIGPMNGEGVVGSLQGLPVVIDAQVPQNLGAGTNQDVVYISSFDDIILFEDRMRAPSQLRFDAPGAKSLMSALVAYGYSAVCATRQVTGISRIDGTGLIVPSL